MYISCRNWEGNLKNFFSHEDQMSPPSLSENGHLWPTKSKSRISKCIEEGNKINQEECPQVDSKIFDGSALVNILRPVNCRTFDDYAQKLVMTYIKNQLHPVKRVNMVWDQYFPVTLKEKKRETILAQTFIERLKQMVICQMLNAKYPNLSYMQWK